MLHQTQVARVIPKYREFLRAYPSLRALAKAPVREVREAWYPLGYNVRPLRLHAIARTAVRRYQGRLPETAEELRRLKGIGRYTAAAVMTFAYDRPQAILDTNVRRVLRRVFYHDGRVSDRTLWALSASLLPERRGYDFNQALMDFGATVCTARAPACATCPLRSACTTFPHPASR